MPAVEHEITNNYVGYSKLYHRCVCVCIVKVVAGSGTSVTTTKQNHKRDLLKRTCKINLWRRCYLLLGVGLYSLSTTTQCGLVAVAEYKAHASFMCISSLLL
jgi:hypothetical protein